VIELGKEFLVNRVRGKLLIHGAGEPAHAAFPDGEIAGLVEDGVC